MKLKSRKNATERDRVRTHEFLGKYVKETLHCSIKVILSMFDNSSIEKIGNHKFFCLAQHGT